MKKTMLFVCIIGMVSGGVEAAQPVLEMTMIAKPLEKHTLVRKHVSSKEAPWQQSLFKRTTEYPTQIVRMQAEVKGGPQTCDEVIQKIDAFFGDQITPDLFFYNTMCYCSYDPETYQAKRFAISSYFDPLTDEAIVYLKKYLAEHNGRDLLGAPFYVESAQGMVVSLDMDAGLKESRNADELLLLQHENASHYFSSDYVMQGELIADVHHRFFSTDPKEILPFIDKWFLTSTLMYERVLGRSNYVELRPDLIFLMDKGPKIFTPMLRLYYAHYCSEDNNGRCL